MPRLWVQLWSFHSSRFYCLTFSRIWVQVHGLLWCSLPSACGLRPLQCVYTPWCLGCCLRSLRGAHSPRYLRFGLNAPQNRHRSTMQPGGEKARAAATEKFPKLSPSVSFFFFHFFFLRKSSCSILPLHTREGLSSHTAHLSS